MTLLYLVASWIAGIILGSALASPAYCWIALALGGFVAAWLARRRPRQSLALLCGGIACLGIVRYSAANRPLTPGDIGYYADSGYVTLTGIISRDPDVRSQHVNLRVQAEALGRWNETTAVSGAVLVQAPRYGDYAYGDRVRVSGMLLTPPEFDTFSYRDYLARQNIHAMIPSGRVVLLDRDKGQPWYEMIYAIKGRAQQTIDRLLPSPQAPLLSGILLGVETAIPDPVRDAFNRTGTTHIIAISGANIIIILRVLMGLFVPLAGRTRAVWIAVATVAAYAILVGGDPAVVRAAIMGSLALVASRLGRRTYGLTTLAFSVWLMTLVNPMVLWDIGFQLSVAATTGLVVFSQDFEAILERGLQRVFAPSTARQVTQWLSEPLAVSLAAQVTTTPLILLYFGRFSIIGLVANLLIVPVQPYIMTVGWLAVLAGMAWTPIGQIVAWAVWIPLTYTLEIVRELGSLSWASFQVNFAGSTAGLIYAGLLILMLLKIQHPDDRAHLARRLRQQITPSLVVLAGGIVAFLVWAVALTQPDRELHVWFLDVGHGQGVLVRTPDGAHLLVDGGPNPTQLRQAVGDVMPFWNRTLDLLIFSQPERSAIGGLPELVRHYDVQLALSNGQPGDDAEFAELVENLADQGTEVMSVIAGHRIVTNDGVTIEVLHPQALPLPTDESDTSSLVIRISYGNTSFLLGPDLSVEGERELVDSGWFIGSTVVMLPAHGRAKENSLEFLQAVRPQAAVALVGAGNRAGLPDREVVERVSALTGRSLFRTDKHGTIEMVTDGETLRIYTDH